VFETSANLFLAFDFHLSCVECFRCEAHNLILIHQQHYFYTRSGEGWRSKRLFSPPSVQLQRIREIVYSRRERSTTPRNETKRKRLHMVEPCIHQFDGWRDQGHIFTFQSFSDLSKSSTADLNRFSAQTYFFETVMFNMCISVIRSNIFILDYRRAKFVLFNEPTSFKGLCC